MRPKRWAARSPYRRCLLAILLNLETCDCWTYPDEDFDRSTRTQDNSTLLLQRRKQPECPRFDLGAQCCLRRLVT